VADAVSYVAVVAALLAMRVPAREREVHATRLWQKFTEGVSYTFGFAPMRAVLLLLALVSFMGMPYSVLLPIFAVDVLQAGPLTLGLLTGATGVGALAGALYLASRRTVLGLGRVIVVATILFGLGLIGFALSRVLWLSLPLLLVVGFGMMVQMAASNTILQTIVDEDKRGRVMSFYSMAFLGMVPLGSLFAGTVAGVVDASGAVLIGGGACVAGGALFAVNLPRLRTMVRPLYARLGILPEVASGMQSAAELTLPPHE
jgi:MFS family permease